MPSETEDVFILGAGFSRSISSRMPLTDELGAECLLRLEAEDRNRAGMPTGFSGGTFESFMSMLATVQPYLTDRENLRNRRLFAEFSEAIADVLNERQFDVVSRDAPRWLEDMVSVWHRRRAAVITFNYDTLVEATTHPAIGLLNEASKTDGDGQFPWPALTNYQPPDPPGDLRLHGPNVPTMRLLKLHGSTNWFWQADDPTGLSAARRQPAGAFGMPALYDPEETARYWPGRTAMIIPPTASKSAYYRTPLLRDIWLRARLSIAGAKRVHVVGYSLPVTDLSTREMLRASLVPSEAKVVIADIDPNGVRDRVENLGVDASRFDACYSSVESLAMDVVVGASGRLLGELSKFEPDSVVAVHWGNRAYSVVTGLERRADLLVLRTDEPTGKLTWACRSRGPSEKPGLSVRALCEAGSAKALWVEAGEDSAYVVAGRQYAEALGHSERWTLLSASRSYSRPID